MADKSDSFSRQTSNGRDTSPPTHKKTSQSAMPRSPLAILLKGRELMALELTGRIRVLLRLLEELADFPAGHPNRLPLIESYERLRDQFEILLMPNDSVAQLPEQGSQGFLDGALVPRLPRQVTTKSAAVEIEKEIVALKILLQELETL